MKRVKRIPELHLAKCLYPIDDYRIGWNDCFTDFMRDYKALKKWALAIKKSQPKRKKVRDE